MNTASPSRPVSLFILTGDPGNGKSTFLAGLIEGLKQGGFRVSGILAPCMDRGSRAYALMDIGTGKTLPLSTGQFVGHWEKAGAFYFNPAALELGRNILMDPLNAEKDLVVLDEVGPFEISGRIWSGALGFMTENLDSALLLVVRQSLVEAVISKWKLPSPVIIDIDVAGMDAAYDMIVHRIKETG